MSNPSPPPPEPVLTPDAGGGCASVLMLLAGIVMLLPGLCSLAFIVTDSGGSLTRDSSIVALWIICLAISAAGIFLIRAAVRRRPR